MAERLFDSNKRRASQSQLIPAGQLDLFEALISGTIQSAEADNLHNKSVKAELTDAVV